MTVPAPGRHHAARPSRSPRRPPAATVSGSSVALAATAADNVGVARVEFKVDGTLIASDLTAPYAATWNATSATAGSHTILATAYDAAGNSAGSSVDRHASRSLRRRYAVASTASTTRERLALLHRVRGREEQRHRQPLGDLLARRCGLQGQPRRTQRPLHRFYNKKNGSHFYTASEAEKNSVIANLSATYSYDGVAYNVSATQVAGSTPVYRFFNKNNGSHFYTASEAEKNSVLANLSATYALDGVAFYAVP